MKHDIIIIDTDGKIKPKPVEPTGYGTLFGSFTGSVTGSGNFTGTTIFYGTSCGSISGGTAATAPPDEDEDEGEGDK